MSDYWTRRKAQEMHRYMEQAESVSDQIAKLYQKASGYVRNQADQIFERFRQKHHLSKSEAYRLLNTLQDKTSLDELKKALRASGDDTEHAALLAELESPAYRARLERLKQLQNQMDLLMRDVYHKEKAFSTSHYVDLANEAYYRSIFFVQQQTGLGFSFNLVDRDLIDRALQKRWYGANYSERIWRNTQSLARSLKEELLVNLVTGRTDREAADIIANKFASGASNARRLVRTESCELANQMEMQSYEECGIETYIFVATLDLRTSPACRERDGKSYPVAEQRPGVNCPPMHPWCRSTTVCDISDKELARMKRAARDPVTGKVEMVPADMTYEQWHKKYVQGRPEAELKEKMLRNRVSDKKQYEKYRKLLEKKAPESFEKFQEMKYNNTDEWNRFKKRASTYSEIDKKDWSDEFKSRAKRSYDKFEKEGFLLSAHALSRLPRLNKKGYHQIDENDLLNLLKGKPGYKEGESRHVWFDADKQIAVIQDDATKDIVSLVRRKNKKEGWTDADI